MVRRYAFWTCPRLWTSVSSQYTSPVLRSASNTRARLDSVVGTGLLDVRPQIVNHIRSIHRSTRQVPLPAVLGMRADPPVISSSVILGTHTPRTVPSVQDHLHANPLATGRNRMVVHVGGRTGGTASSSWPRLVQSPFRALLRSRWYSVFFSLLLVIAFRALRHFLH